MSKPKKPKAPLKPKAPEPKKTIEIGTDTARYLVEALSIYEHFLDRHAESIKETSLLPGETKARQSLCSQAMNGVGSARFELEHLLRQAGVEFKYGFCSKCNDDKPECWCGSCHACCTCGE